MEETPEVNLPPVIKTSNRPDIQSRVDEKLIQMEEDNPSSDLERTNLELISANKYARQMVASDLKEERAKDQAGVDLLTGILNRKGYEKEFNEKLKAVSRTGSKLLGIVMDANGLKQINDEKGHEAGDEYIKKIANALKQNGRESDIVARVGGDEFITILDNPDENGLAAWWDRLPEDVKLSAGVIEIDQKDPNAWFAKADEAMYAAKLNKDDEKSHLMIVQHDGNFVEYTPAPVSLAA